jgi:FAD:protein FMN transferase
MSGKRRIRPILGTLVEIGVCGNAEYRDTTITKAFDGLAHIHSLMSFHDPKSDLSRLNASLREEIDLQPHTAQVLQRALRLGRRSHGLFNCTVGGALVKRGILPDQGGVEPLDFGHCDDVKLDGRKAKLLKPLRITLDGIAKGYAVDYAISILRRSGVSAGWVNAGGDLRVFGNTRLQVHSRDHDGNLANIGELNNASLATSSAFAEPNPNFPACMVRAGGGAIDTGTWSVMAPTAWLADALTKVACLAKPVNRKAVVSALGGALVSIP